MLMKPFDQGDNSGGCGHRAEPFGLRVRNGRCVCIRIVKAAPRLGKAARRGFKRDAQLRCARGIRVHWAE